MYTMNSLKALQDRLSKGEVIILDGAIGTELERLGAPMHEEIWCGQALETHPELVSSVHRSYIAAGADVITTNTYSTSRHALQQAGLEGKTGEWNALAVNLAVEARANHAADRPVCIAGSVSGFSIRRTYSADELRPSFAEQGRLLVDGGVDLILLETLASPADIVCAGVEETSGLGVPVWVAISCLEDRETGELFHGVEESQQHSEVRRAYEPFALAIRRAMAKGGSAVLMMHSDLAVTEAAVTALRQNYHGTVGAYPNAGYWLRPQWAFVDQVTPDDYLARAQSWVAAGAQIVGGCCGIGPDHIRALRHGLGLSS